MALLRVVIPDDLENELREIVPARKGALSQFVAEAIKQKIEEVKISKNR